MFPTDHEQIIIQVYGDSVSLPRIERGIGVAKIYPELYRTWMEATYPEKKVYLYNRSQGAIDIEGLHNVYQKDRDYFDRQADRVMILEVGVVDAPPRPVPTWFKNNILAKLPLSIRQPIVRFLHHNRPFLIKAGFRFRVTSPKKFRNIYAQWIKQASQDFTRIYVLTIIPTLDKVEQHSPGFTASIELFNQILKTAHKDQEVKNVLVIDLYQHIKDAPEPLETYIDETDGHHLTEAGHQLCAGLLIEREDTLKSVKKNLHVYSDKSWKRGLI